MFYNAALAHPVTMIMQPSGRHMNTMLLFLAAAADDLCSSDCCFNMCFYTVAR